MNVNLLIMIGGFLVGAVVILIVLESATGVISTAWSSVMFTVMEAFSSMFT